MIKIDMTMPKSCEECRLKHDNCNEEWYCDVNNKRINWYLEKFPKSGCPLIEVKEPTMRDERKNCTDCDYYRPVMDSCHSKCFTCDNKSNFS